MHKQLETRDARQTRQQRQRRVGKGRIPFLEESADLWTLWSEWLEDEKNKSWKIRKRIF